MHGIRIYTPAMIGNSQPVKPVFYSRRDGGPFYLWRYDQELATWRPARVNTADVLPQTFSAATWKSLPHSLRTRIGEHYVE